MHFVAEDQPKNVEKSKRRNFESSEQDFKSDIQATPEFRQFVGKKLSEIMDKSIKVVSKDLPDEPREEQEIEDGVKLLSSSKSFLKLQDSEENELSSKKKRPDLLAHRKDKEQDKEEAFKAVAVSPQWVLEKQGVYGPEANKFSKVITKM